MTWKVWGEPTTKVGSEPQGWTTPGGNEARLGRDAAQIFLVEQVVAVHLEIGVVPADAAQVVADSASAVK